MQKKQPTEDYVGDIAEVMKGLNILEMFWTRRIRKNILRSKDSEISCPELLGERGVVRQNHKP